MLSDAFCFCFCLDVHGMCVRTLLRDLGIFVEFGGKLPSMLWNIVGAFLETGAVCVLVYDFVCVCWC